MATKSKRTGHASSTSFKPGTRANPNGRPPTEVSVVGQLKIQLKQAVREGELDPEDYEQKLDFLTAYTKKLLKTAAKTTDPTQVLSYWKEFRNTVDGMPTAHVDHTTLGEKLPTPLLGSIATEASED